MRKPKDRLSEAIARLKQQGQMQEAPKAVVEETLRRIAASGAERADSGTPVALVRHSHFAIHGLFRLAAAAALFVSIGYGAGRLSAPKPPDMDQLRADLIPSVAEALEPALRKRVGDDFRRDYQLALAGMYVRVKEELTDQYRSDLNRFALQTLAASNAVTNKLLLQLVQSIDTAQAQDRRRIAEVISEIEENRVQDKTQLASGLQTLAYRTEDELSRTKWQLAQLLTEARPVDSDLSPAPPSQTHQERNTP